MAIYHFEKIWGIEFMNGGERSVECLIENFNRGKWIKLLDGRVMVPGLSWVYAKKVPATPETEEYVGVYFSNENKLLGYVVKGAKEWEGSYGLSGTDYEGEGRDALAQMEDHDDFRGGE